MNSESEWIYERQQLYRLLREHPNWSLRAYARELHHDPKWVRKWVQRFQQTPPISLELFASQSRKPHHRPTQIAETIKNRICELRGQLSERFYRPAGAKTIWYFLCQESNTNRLVPCPSSIQKVLHERAYIQPRPKATPLPLILPAPMEEWEMDFGEIELGEEGSLEFLLVVDKGTSRVIYLEGSSGYRAESALEAVARLLTLHGLPQRLRFDRDPRLWGSWTRDSYPSPLICFLRTLGVEAVVCPPQRPDKKPMVERCIRTLKHEWLRRFAPSTFADALDLLPPFVSYHNKERPHQGDACQNRIPDEVFSTLPALPSLPQRVQPDAWLKHEHGRIYRRRVNANGSIQVDRHSYYVGVEFAKVPVLVHLDAPRALFHITCEGTVLKSLPMKGLQREMLDFSSYLQRMKAEARTVERYRHLHWEQTGDTF